MQGDRDLFVTCVGECGGSGWSSPSRLPPWFLCVQARQVRPEAPSCPGRDEAPRPPQCGPCAPPSCSPPSPWRPTGVAVSGGVLKAAGDEQRRRRPGRRGRHSAAREPAGGARRGGGVSRSEDRRAATDQAKKAALAHPRDRRRSRAPRTSPTTTRATSPGRCSASTASPRTSSPASTRSTSARAAGGSTPTTPPPRPTASRRRCPGRRWRRPAPTGRPTPRPRSGGDSATSVMSTAHLAARTPSRPRTTGTEPPRVGSGR